MAYINVGEWTPEHVAEWLRGLDDSILPYVQFFVDNNVNGCKLLLLTTGDLDHLNVTKVSQQEIIMEGVDLLRHLHYSLGTETLQALALRLGCKARSLMIQLEHEKNASPKIVSSSSSVKDSQHYFDFTKVDSANNINITKPGEQRVSLTTLIGVSDILGAVKIFISWLDRYPFADQPLYGSIRKAILGLSIELSSTAQRDQFVEHPNDIIKRSCISLAKHCDYIVQGLTDSLAIQTTYLEVVTVKKKPKEDLGMVIRSSTLGMHIIDKVIFSSASHRSGRIDEGDEIVQVDYQTVVGWTHTKLINMMSEYPVEIILTIKKRPTHSRILSQVAMRNPYQIQLRRLSTTNGRTNGAVDIGTVTDTDLDSQVELESVNDTMSRDNSTNSRLPTSQIGRKTDRLDKSVSLHDDHGPRPEAPKEPKGPVYDISSFRHRKELRRRNSIGSTMSVGELNLAPTTATPWISGSPATALAGTNSKDSVSKTVSNDPTFYAAFHHLNMNTGGQTSKWIDRLKDCPPPPTAQHN